MRQDFMLDTRVTLLQRVRDRADAAAWSEFVAIYKPLLLAYVRKRGVDVNDAEDVVQDVFTRLVPAMARFDYAPDQGRFRTWLWQVTHHALSDWSRRRAAHSRAERHWADAQNGSGDDTPDDAWASMYRGRILEVAIERVRASTQRTTWDCFEARILRGRPAAEVASELGVSVNAVYVNASRVLARVREQCAEFSESLESP
jgi:RNA polymerase sigma factor (sigma-70 family)